MARTVQGPLARVVPRNNAGETTAQPPPQHEKTTSVVQEISDHDNDSGDESSEFNGTDTDRRLLANKQAKAQARRGKARAGKRSVREKGEDSEDSEGAGGSKVRVGGARKPRDEVRGRGKGKEKSGAAGTSRKGKRAGDKEDVDSEDGEGDLNKDMGGSEPPVKVAKGRSRKALTVEEIQSGIKEGELFILTGSDRCNRCEASDLDCLVSLAGGSPSCFRCKNSGGCSFVGRVAEKATTSAIKGDTQGDDKPVSLPPPKFRGISALREVCQTLQSQISTGSTGGENQGEAEVEAGQVSGVEEGNEEGVSAEGVSEVLKEALGLLKEFITGNQL